MPERFYFDLINSHESKRDDVGVEAADFRDAVEQAQSVIEEMLGRGDLPEDAAAWALVVRSADGRRMRILPIR